MASPGELDWLRVPGQSMRVLSRQIAEFIRRGWTEKELAGLMGGNLQRIMFKVEEAAVAARGRRASTSVYSQRRDLPASEWGGPGGAYLPPKVKRVVDSRRLRDEL